MGESLGKIPPGAKFITICEPVKLEKKLSGFKVQ